MRKTAFLALLVVGLAGCATTAPSTYGNFTQSAPAAFNQTMADDAVKQLVAVYPPASTRFDLQHATPDAFGSSLVESLRAKGYALGVQTGRAGLGRIGGHGRHGDRWQTAAVHPRSS